MTTDLHTGFRWYNDIEKQNRSKEYCYDCSFKLISKPNTFLPFIIRARPTVDVSNIVIYCADDDTELTTINSSYLSKTTVGNYDYISYNGEDITGLVLECGTYYARILTDNEIFYSEVFTVLDFEEPILLPNGDFSDDSSWEQIGSSSDWAWFINLGSAVFSKIGTANVSGVFSNQVPPFLLIKKNISYRIKYTLASISPGFGAFNFNVIVGETNGAIRTSLGTYIETIEANENGYVQLKVEKNDTDVGNLRVDDITVEAFVPDDHAIFTAWRWYDNQQKQNRYKEYCGEDCGFNLISLVDAPPPFIFGFNQIDILGPIDIQSWVLRNEDCEIQLNTDLLNNYESSDFIYVYYNGESSPMTLEALDLPNGDFSDNENWVEQDVNNAEWDINGILDRGRFVCTSGFGSSIFSNSADAPLEIIAGNVYVITYTITTFTGDDAYLNVIIGDTQGEPRTATGTYTETLIALNDGYVKLYAQSESQDSVTIMIDDISISLAEPIPCGIYESVITINGIEYFSEWIIVTGQETTESESNYLLQEDGFMILQEDGFGILIE